MVININKRKDFELYLSNLKKEGTHRIAVIEKLEAALLHEKVDYISGDIFHGCSVNEVKEILEIVLGYTIG